MQFLRISTRKNLRVFTARPSFFVLYMIVYQSALIPRKLSCPQKFLVTRLLYRTHMVFVHKKLFFIQNTLSFIFKILIHRPCIQSIPLSTFEKKLNTDRKNSVRLEKTQFNIQNIYKNVCSPRLTAFLYQLEQHPSRKQRNLLTNKLYFTELILLQSQG